MLCLVVHSNVSSYLMRDVGECASLNIHFLNLVIDVRISSGLEDLMPLLCFRVELIHIIRSTIRVCACKQVE